MHVRALVVVAVAHLARASIEAEAEEAAVYTCDESRVRKSWSLFSAKEKATYVSAVKALSDAGHYSTFVGLHLMLGDFIHATAMFFPFNRLFVWEFENALRATAKEYACVTVPLWDWAADNQAALTSNALNSTDATTPWAETHAFLADMGGASNWSAAAFTDTIASPCNMDAFKFGGRGAGTCYVSRVSHGAASPETARECGAAPASDGPLNAPFGLFADATFDDDFALKLVSSECAAEYAPLASRARDWSGVAAPYTDAAGANASTADVDAFAGVLGMTAGDLATWLTNETRYGTKPEDRDAAAHFCATYANYSSVGDLLGAPRAGSTSGCGLAAKASLGPLSWLRAALGGSMATNRAPADPIFWGAHAYLDYVWDVWARAHSCPHDERAIAAGVNGSRFVDVPPALAGHCDGYFDCWVCGHALTEDAGATGYWAGQPYNDSLDDAIPFAMPALALRANVTDGWVKPPGVTARSWNGTRTARELLSLEFWDGYRVDSANLSLAGLRGSLLSDGDRTLGPTSKSAREARKRVHRHFSHGHREAFASAMNPAEALAARDSSSATATGGAADRSVWAFYAATSGLAVVAAVMRARSGRRAYEPVA